MYLIVGLGNPGKEYENTRHNVGFSVIEKISKDNEMKLDKKDFDGIYTKGKIKNQEVILLKPTTYMNLSGKSIKMVSKFFKIDLKNIIVIYDDVDIEIGKIRIKPKGSSGLHNGIKSIIEELGTNEFTRIRIGIGKAKYDMVNHVLGKFEKDEQKQIEEVVEKTSLAINEILIKGLQSAMNKNN